MHQSRVRWGSSVTRVTVYALNLFDIADRDEYLAYSKRSPQEVAKHGGRVVALGRFRESITGEIEPRNGTDTRRMGVEGRLRQLLQ